MADLQTKSFDVLVSEQAAAVQGASAGLVDFTAGSILRAIVESYSAVALWLQGLILKLLQTTRAATSTGADLDSWFADFGFERLGATAATGLATFSRFTATAAASVPVGAMIQTADGQQQYAVVADTTNAAFSSQAAGYVLGPGVTSLAVPIVAATLGAAANAAIGGINTIAQALPGIDTVANAAALTNGSDAESDGAARVRFVQYLSSLSKATKAAVAYAILSVETGLTYTLVENADYDGSSAMGHFYVVVDDGSGDPASGLLNRIYAAIDAVRPIGSVFGVFAPIVVTANVVMQIKVAAAYDGTATANIVQTAVTNYVNSLPLGASLIWSRLIQVAFDASDGITDVTGLLVNAATDDIVATPKQVVKAGSVAAAVIS